jgi:Putative phage abortive infection protein
VASQESKGNILIKWAIWICIIGASILIILGVVAAFVGYRVPRHDENFLNDVGNWGSYLQGTTASLWSLAGLLIIFVAFLAQKQQLLLQNDQLKEQRNQFEIEQQRQQSELEDQKSQFRLQLQSIKLQNFESSFFQLLNMQNQIAAGMRDSSEYRTNDSSHIQTIEGRNCFMKWYKSFSSNFTDNNLQRIANVNLPNNRSDIRIAILFYEEFYEKYQGDLGHYFRSLYHTIKFVESSEAVVTYEEKRRYTSLVRAQLSAYELSFLFYNGICPIAKKFKPLIVEFGLLEHLDKKLLLDSTHESFYDKTAFK